MRATTPARIATVNPATGETVKTFDALSIEELDAFVKSVMGELTSS